MALPAAVALRSGDLLPRIGLGVYKALPSETEAAVASALRLGYRHVDTAQVYGNEAEVGRAVAAFEAEHAAAGTRVFVTTKARVVRSGAASVAHAHDAPHGCRCGRAPGGSTSAAAPSSYRACVRLLRAASRVPWGAR